jgi:hypothetical protein
MPEGPRLTIASAAKVGRVLAGCIAFLVVVHVVTTWVSQQGYGLHRTARLFDLDQESNIPTWFSSLLLAAAAATSFVISHQCRGTPAVRPWLGLALIFVGMSVDETASLHEMFGPGITQALGFKAQGVLTCAWVLPGLAVAALVAGIFARFVYRLPRRVRRLTLLSGAFYAFGAIGCEMIYSSMLGSGIPDTAWPARLEIVVEETLEMAGVALWIYTQLLYLHDRQAATASG